MIEDKKVLFNIPVFLLSFSLGLLYVYLFTPHKHIIIKYPNPFNADKLIYKSNDDNTCYKYKAEKIDCPKDTTKILDHPVTI